LIIRIIGGRSTETNDTHRVYQKVFNIYKIRHYGFEALGKAKALRELRVKVLEKVERNLLPKCPCCKTGNLHRI
jgi:hypothetical protein